MRAFRPLIPLVFVAVLAACATTSSREGRRNSDVLTRPELEASGQITAYDAIQQIRPLWLRARGPNSFHAENPVAIYVDGMRSGGVEALQGIPVQAVERIRYYDATEAQARFGLNNTNGAIEVVTRRGP